MSDEPALSSGVDTHARYFGADLARQLSGIADPRRPSPVTGSDGAIAPQLISPVPVMLAYWADESVARACARGARDFLVSEVAGPGGAARTHAGNGKAFLAGGSSG